MISALRVRSMKRRVQQASRGGGLRRAQNHGGPANAGVHATPRRRSGVVARAKAIEIEDIEARVSELERAAGLTKHRRSWWLLNNSAFTALIGSLTARLAVYDVSIEIVETNGPYSPPVRITVYACSYGCRRQGVAAGRIIDALGRENGSLAVADGSSATRREPTCEFAGASKQQNADRRGSRGREG